MRMKKVFAASVLGTILFFSFAFADPDINRFTPAVAEESGFAAADKTTLAQNIGQVIKTVLSLTGVIFLALTVYAGILWMTAGGNETQAEKAQGIIKMAVIGLVIVLAAYSITYFVMRGLSSASTGQVPQEKEPDSWVDTVRDSWGS